MFPALVGPEPELRLPVYARFENARVALGNHIRLHGIRLEGNGANGAAVVTAAHTFHIEISHGKVEFSGNCFGA